MAKEKNVYRVSTELVEAWQKKFSEEDKKQFAAKVTQETVYRIPKEMADAWRKKFPPVQKVKVDVDELLQDVELQDKVARIAKLEEQGATWNAEERIWSVGDKTYDADGNPR